MPAAEQPGATATHVIPMGMDMPVSLPMMPLYAIVMGDSGRHKHQRANYSRDEANLCNIQTSLLLRGPMLLIISTRTTLPCSRLVHHDAVKPPITQPNSPWYWRRAFVWSLAIIIETAMPIRSGMAEGKIASR